MTQNQSSEPKQIPENLPEQTSAAVRDFNSGDDNPELSEQDKNREKIRQKLKFYGFVAIMVIMCAVFIWFIFKPDKTKEAAGESGINMSIPEASVQDTESDKRKALEVAELEDKQQRRVQSLFDFDSGLPEEDSEPQPVVNPVLQSQENAQQLNKQLNTYYTQPREDPQVAELKRQVEELTGLLREQQVQAGGGYDEMDFIEKSYEMASRYFPGQQVQQVAPPVDEKEAERATVSARRGNDNTVSSLADFVLTPQERNYGFVTPVGAETIAVSNAIRACVDNDQVIVAGAQVRLRLLEPLLVGNFQIPVNSPIYGNAQIQSQRVSITVTSVESEGNIIPVELVVHDMDGQRGLNVPNSMERTAAKEALANMGQNFGTSISVAQNAGQQVAMDLTRGVLTGGSQYLGSKMREVKISLKAGYQVLLIAKD